MVKALFDTNVLIDYLNTVPQAKSELARYPDKAISIVSWFEVLVGARPEHEPGTRNFLAQFEIVHLDQDIADEAVALRRKHRMKLPDAIIWATARTRGLLLTTRNTKDFPRHDPAIRIPYKI